MLTNYREWPLIRIFFGKDAGGDKLSELFKLAQSIFQKNGARYPYYYGGTSHPWVWVLDSAFQDSLRIIQANAALNQVELTDYQLVILALAARLGYAGVSEPEYEYMAILRPLVWCCDRYCGPDTTRSYDQLSRLFGLVMPGLVSKTH